MKRKLTFIFAIQLLTNLGNAQVGKYLVLFKDKNNNTYSTTNPIAFVNQRSIDRRTAQGIAFTIDDLPPTQAYIDGLKAISGITVWYKSRWANAALVLMDKSLESNVLALPYVKGFENGQALDKDGAGNPQGRIRSKFDVEIDNANYGTGVVQTKMLGVNHLHNAGFKGDNILIAVIDDGFNNVDKDLFMSHLFTNNKIVHTFDFQRNSPNVYDVGGHGHAVLSNIAANGTVSGASYVGTAPNSNFALLRSENAPSERLIEEANYLFACERADSLGADIINTSLGYKGYDYSPYSHITTDMNGNKVLSTRAADWAARAGILAVISAGNSGTSGIASPADADSVLTVGAVTAAEIKSGFSSVGNTFDSRIKPTIAAMGSSVTASYYNPTTMVSYLGLTSGTSFSSPISAGFAACLWQANPSLKNMDIIDLMKSIATQVASPDKLLGYGIPKIRLATNGELSSKIIQPAIENTFLNANSTRTIAQIKAQGANPVSGNITTKVFIDNTVQTTPRPYLQRHFEVNPDNTDNNLTAKITLFISQTEIDNFNSNNGSFYDLPTGNTDVTGISKLRILQKHGLSLNGGNSMADYLGATEIIDPLDTDIVWNAIEKFWEISFPITGFSGFFIVSDNSAPLPVKLVSFIVKPVFSGNSLEWSTSSEINLAYFEIQKSNDSKDFNSIEKVFSIKKSNEIGQYSYLDNLIIENTISYYRLKMVDLDGKFEYSKIISAKRDNKDLVKIVSNPISNELELWIDNEIKNDFEIKVFDVSGKILFNKKYNKEDNRLIINTLKWNIGEYILELLSADNNFTKKFFKM